MPTIRNTLTATALVLAGALALPASAEENVAAPAVPSQSGPVTNDADGSARTSLPEQDASPQGTGERPNSAASRKADEIK